MSDFFPACSVAQSCPILCDPMDYSPWNQAPLPMESSWQEYWSGVPFPTPWDLPNPGIKPTSLASPALAGEYFTSSANWDTLFLLKKC